MSHAELAQSAALQADLEAPIAELLRRVPEHWAKYSVDALTERESQSLHSLVAAEMVEQRLRVRLQMFNHRLAVEATLTTTGEYGSVEALERLAAALWQEWRTSYEAWRAGDAKDTPPFHCERLEPSEWRLTSNGVLARQDLANGRGQIVFDFVLRRACFDGNPRLLDGRAVRREPVRGHGRLVSFEKFATDAAPAKVAVANWDEGAAAIGQALMNLFESRHVQERSAANGKADQRRTGRNVETEVRLKRYLTDRAGLYQELVEAILRGDTAALRRFQEEFGPTAFARHVAEENGVGGDDEEIQRIKTAVQQTTLYQERIKPVLSCQPPRGGTDDTNAVDDQPVNEIINQMRRQARGDGCGTS